VTLRTGDTVKWIDNDLPNLKQGLEFEVEGVSKFMGFPMICVRGVGGFWHPSRFELTKRSENG